MSGPRRPVHVTPLSATYGRPPMRDHRPSLFCLLLVAALCCLASFGARTASAAPVEIAGAPDLTWGFKNSWRVYAPAPAVSGGASLIPGTPYDLGWKFDSGSYDEATRTTVLRYEGSAHWLKYYYPDFTYLMTPPPGYAGPLDIHLLDVTMSDPVITISGDSATISVEAQSRQLDDWLIDDLGRVDVAALDVGGVDPTISDGTTTWSGIPAMTTAGSTFVFANNYPLGLSIDEVGFSYQGPGGAPDLYEHFDLAGSAKLELATNHVITTNGPPIGSEYENWDVDPERRIVYYASQHSSESGFTHELHAFDLDTLSTVGQPMVSTNEFSPRGLVFDSATGRFLYSSDNEHLDSWYRFDKAAGEFKRGLLAHPVPVPADVLYALNWDPFGERIFTIRRHNPDMEPDYDDPDFDWEAYAEGMTSELLTWKEGADGTWEEAAYPIPDLEAEPEFSAYQSDRAAAAADGSIVVLGSGQVSCWPVTELETCGVAAKAPGAYRIVIDDDEATVEPIGGGTEIDNMFPANYTGILTGPDGQLTLTREGNGEYPAAVENVFVSAAGEVESEAPVAVGAIGPVFYDYAVDPTDGTVWAGGFKSQRLLAVRDGRVVTDQYFKERHPRGGPIVVAPDHTLYARTNDGSPAGFGGSPSYGFGRFTRVGLTATPTAQPQDVSVSLSSGQASKAVSFTAAATGEPAPLLQWQVKKPGSTRFADIVDATGGTLSVSAQAGMGGSQYRAIFTNAAGRVASETASLAVAYAPRVSFEPPDISVTEGQDAKFSLLADGSPTPEVTWQRRVAGFWQDITSADDGLVPDGTSLTVTETDTAQTGALFRAKIANSAGAAHSRAAKLTVTPRTIPPGGVDVTEASLDWLGNEEVQSAPPFGGSNYLAAGASVAGSTEAGYHSVQGNAAIYQVSKSGAEALATYGTRAAHVASGGRQLARLYCGHGHINPDGSGAIAWQGAFSVNFYGGLVPFTIANPEIYFSVDGTGYLSANLALRLEPVRSGPVRAARPEERSGHRHLQRRQRRPR